MLAAYPVDAVMKMTEVEAARLAALDAEVRNNLQGLRIMDLEQEKIDRDYTTDRAQRQLQRAALVGQFDQKKRQYQQFVTELARKHQLDPTKMSFDTDTRVLRDLRDNNDEEKKE